MPPSACETPPNVTALSPEWLRCPRLIDACDALALGRAMWAPSPTPPSLSSSGEAAPAILRPPTPCVARVAGGMKKRTGSLALLLRLAPLAGRLLGGYSPATCIFPSGSAAATRGSGVRNGVKWSSSPPATAAAAEAVTSPPPRTLPMPSRDS